jgi:hypothetical protein
MPSENNPARYLSIREIADQYDKSVAAVRLSLNKRLQELADKAPEAERKEVRERARVHVGGRTADKYEEEFVLEAMGGKPPAGRHFGETEKHIFGRNAKGALIKVIGGKAGDPLPLTGVLASRRRADSEYHELVNEMTRQGHGLRIRCITGTDFFNSQLVWYGQLASRIEAKLGPPKVLLVYPFERAANLRSSAEGEDLARSQFRRDAIGTYEFLKAYSFGNDDKDLWVSAKWVDEIPPSLLIWCEECALVEPYDYGGRGNDRAGCIGRKAPILVVPGGHDFHKALKDSFDYLYDEKGRDENGQPYIKTYTLKQVAEVYEEKQTDRARTTPANTARTKPRKTAR